MDPLLHGSKHAKPRNFSKTVFILVLLCLGFVGFYFRNWSILSVSKESLVGTKKLWGLLKDIKIPDVKGIPRTWSEYYCKTSKGHALLPHCKGEQHSCALAGLLFKQFRTLYLAKPDSQKPAVEFPHTVFHMDNKFDNPAENQKAFTSSVIQHMREAAQKEHRMLWLVEIFPNHAFLLEQGDPTPTDFRLYQSRVYGFDINYWLSESRMDVPCYTYNWGLLKEFKYDRENDKQKAMDHDLKVLEIAKNTYGSHKTFDAQTFEEIFTKLAFGWKFFEDNGIRLQILERMEKWETPALDITGQNKPLWSLKHIFGMEPIELKSLEETRPPYLGITVQTLDLGTKDDFEKIETNIVELEAMNKNPTGEDVNLVPVFPPKRPSS